jgi:hypothetical protein
MEMVTTITLANGEKYTRIATRRRFWKSLLMDMCPYGTDFMGCEFSFRKA